MKFHLSTLINKKHRLKNWKKETPSLDLYPTSDTLQPQYPQISYQGRHVLANTGFVVAPDHVAQTQRNNSSLQNIYRFNVIESVNDWTAIAGWVFQKKADQVAITIGVPRIAIQFRT